MISIQELYNASPIGNRIYKNQILTDNPIVQSTDSKKNKKIETHFYRKNIKKDQLVSIVKKKNQGTEIYTDGKVADILTKKSKHTRGIKVRLDNGSVGRIVKIYN